MRGSFSVLSDIIFTAGIIVNYSRVGFFPSRIYELKQDYQNVVLFSVVLLNSVHKSSSTFHVYYNTLANANLQSVKLGPFYQIICSKLFWIAIDLKR